MVLERGTILARVLTKALSAQRPVITTSAPRLSARLIGSAPKYALALATFAFPRPIGSCASLGWIQGEFTGYLVATCCSDFRERPALHHSEIAHFQFEKVAHSLNCAFLN